MPYTNLKRGLSLLLVLVMAFSMVPVSVFATETETTTTELQGTLATESTVGPEKIPTESTPSTVYECEEALIPILVTEPISLTVSEEGSSSSEIQNRMDVILNQYSITNEMTDMDIVNAIVIADGDTIKATMDEIAKIDAEACVLNEGEFYELDTELYGRFCGLFSDLFNPSLIAAKTNTVLDGKVSVTDSLGNGSLSGGTITIKASGSLFSKKTNNITITNETSDTATVSFDYNVTSANSFKINGNSFGSGSGTYSIILDGSASVQIELTSNNGLSNTTATLKLSNFSYTVAQTSSNVQIEYDSARGSVTVNETAVNSGYSQNVELGTSLTLTTTAKTGYRFLGWTDKATGERLSSAASYAHEPAKDITIVPIFVATTSDSAWFLAGGSHLFNDLNKAATFASSATTKTVVLMNDGTLVTGNYTIPSGVTLLIPFNDANTLCTTSPATTETKSLTKPTAYRTLSMENGANIIVNGAISISGTQHTAMAAGTPFGPVGFIEMASGSTITINNGANLYAWGYITGSGSVTVKSGGKVYECFQVADWRGGSATSSMVENQQRIFPLSQYYLQNVEVPMTLEPGAEEYAHMAVNVSIIGIQTSLVPFIGASDAMFKISEGTMTKRYEGSIDRLAIDLNESNLEISSYTISIKTGILGSVTLNSEDYVLPITSNMTINVNSGSTIKLSQDIAVIPGCEINIEEGSVCTVTNNSSLYVYDSTDWGTYCGSTNKKFIPIAAAPGQKKTRTESDLVDAVVKVNGTLDASAGYIYTTSGSANIYSTGNGKIIQRAGNQTVTYQATYKEDGYDYHEIPITPAKLKNGDGNYVETAEATTPTLYTYTNGTWIGTCVEHTEVTDAAVAATCTSTGLTEGKHCSVCGTVTVAQTEVPALGHTEVTDAAVAPTCTATGLTEGKHCSVCNTVLVAQTEVPALGHKMVSNNDAVLPTYQQTGMTASQTCSICGETTAGTEEPKVVQLNAFAASAAEEVYLEMKFFLPEEMANGTITLTHTVTKNGNTTTDNESYNVSDLTPDANGRYVITHGIASGEMTCPVIVSFQTEGGTVVNVRKGTEISEFASCAVTDYAELVLTKGDDRQKALITNLLTYGGYAQALFNVDASNPAYNLLSKYGFGIPNIAEVTASSISNAATESGPAIGIQKGPQEAFLDSAIYHRVYFTLDAGNTIDNFKFVLTYPVNKVEYTKELTPVFESGKDRYYVEIEDIPAAYLDYDYKISVTNKNTGETYTVTTSVLAYLKALLNNETATTEQKNLAKAMYLYNQQANTFFGK